MGCYNDTRPCAGSKGLTITVEVTLVDMNVTQLYVAGCVVNKCL